MFTHPRLRSGLAVAALILIAAQTSRAFEFSVPLSSPKLTRLSANIPVAGADGDANVALEGSSGNIDASIQVDPRGKISGTGRFTSGYGNEPAQDGKITGKVSPSSRCARWTAASPTSVLGACGMATGLSKDRVRGAGSARQCAARFGSLWCRIAPRYSGGEECPSRPRRRRLRSHQEVLMMRSNCRCTVFSLVVVLVAGLSAGLWILKDGLSPAGATAESKAAGGVIHFDAKEVAARFEKGGMLLTQADCKIMAGHRDKAGIPEVHDADTDVFYIVDGDATFVVGGKVIEPKLESPGETRGLRIEGGEARKITKGDVLMIPRGVPHWFSEVPKTVNYFVVKVTASKKDK